MVGFAVFSHCVLGWCMTYAVAILGSLVVAGGLGLLWGGSGEGWPWAAMPLLLGVALVAGGLWLVAVALP